MQQTLRAMIMFVLAFMLGLLAISSCSAAPLGLGVHYCMEQLEGQGVSYPGVDIRFVGGGGILGAALSLELVPNQAGIASGYPADEAVKLASGYLNAQLPLGWLTLYGGVGAGVYLTSDGKWHNTFEDNGELYVKGGGAITAGHVQVFGEWAVPYLIDDQVLNYERPKVGLGIAWVF